MSRYKRNNKKPFSFSIKCFILSKLINCIMRKGEKRIAIKLLKRTLDYIKNELKLNPIKILHEAIDNVMPQIEIRNMKIGGVSYQIPIDASSNRRLSLGLRWIVSAARLRRESNAWLKLAWEIIDSVLRKSISFKKKESVHSLAKANQAFAHMGW